MNTVCFIYILVKQKLISNELYLSSANQILKFITFYDNLLQLITVQDTSEIQAFVNEVSIIFKEYALINTSRFIVNKLK